MNTKEFNEELSALVKVLSNTLNDGKHKGWDTTIFLVGRDKQGNMDKFFAVIPNLPDTSRDKHDLLFSGGATIAKERPDWNLEAVYIASEAWLKKFNKELDDYDGRRIAHYKDKQEVIVVSGMSTTRLTNFAVCNIIRDDENYMLMGNPEFTYAGEGLQMENNLVDSFIKGWFSVRDENRNVKELNNFKFIEKE